MRYHLILRVGILAFLMALAFGCGKTASEVTPEDAVSDPGVAEDEGKVEEDPGKAEEDPGKAEEDPGKADEDPGKVDVAEDIVMPDVGPPDVPADTGTTEKEEMSFMSAPAELALVGSEYRYRVRVANSGDVQLELVEGPAGMTLTEGAVTWTPDESAVGTFAVGVKATLGDLEAVQEYSLDVMKVDKVAEGDVGTNGGSIQASSSEEGVEGLAVVVPPGAVADDTKIEIGTLEETPKLPGVQNTENIKAIVLGPPGTTFKKPVIIQLPYSSAFDDVAATLQAMVYSESTGTWSRAKVVDRDLEHRVLLVETPHFSVFAAGAPELEVNTAVHPAGGECPRPIAIESILANPLSEVAASAVQGLTPFIETNIIEGAGVGDVRGLLQHPQFIGTLRSIWKVHLITSDGTSDLGTRFLAASVLLPGDGSARAVLADGTGNVLYEMDYPVLLDSLESDIEPFLRGEGYVARFAGPLGTLVDISSEIYLRYYFGDGTSTPITASSLTRFTSAGEGQGAEIGSTDEDPARHDVDCDEIMDGIDPEVDTTRPEITPSPDGSVAGLVGIELELSCEVTGSDAPLTWTSGVDSDVLTPAGDFGVALVATEIGLHLVTCAIDDEGTIVDHTFAVDISEPPAVNTPPTCDISVLDPIVEVGEVAGLFASAYDAETDPSELRIEWGMVAADGSLIPSPFFSALEGPDNSFAAFMPKVYKVGCVAHDGLEYGPVGQGLVEVVEPDVNLPPEHLFLVPAGVQVTVGDPVVLTASSFDPDGDPLNFVWSPSELILDVFDTPEKSEATIDTTNTGIFALTVKVDDGVNPPLTAHATVTVQPEPDPVAVDEDGDTFPAGDGELDDCDDTDPTVNPAADEICDDQIDNNCDGLVDEFPGPDGTTVPCDTGGGEDTDQDTIPDEDDNCPEVPNPSQADTDGDGIGDLCDEGACEPVCDGKVCGDDGCGDLCGLCAEGEKCNEAGQCEEGEDPCATADCDDSDPCTDDACDADSGCTRDPTPGLSRRLLRRHRRLHRGRLLRRQRLRRRAPRLQRRRPLHGRHLRRRRGLRERPGA